MAPKVSVIMSVYNGDRYLREAIDSILNQTFTDFEFIIINDASTDNTAEILAEYAFQDSRIRLIQNEKNIGLTKSLNKGIHLAQGDYIARQDADDISLSNRFARQVDYLDNHPEVVLLSSLIELVDSSGNPFKVIPDVFEPELTDWYSLFDHYLGGHSQFMFHRLPLMEFGGYNEQFLYGQDYVLYCQLAKFGKIIILPEVLLRWRIHGESISTIKRSQQAVYSLTQSIENIKGLTGKEISLEDMQDLRGFIVISFNRYYLPNLYLPLQRVANINRNLRKIYRAFTDQLSTQNSSNLDLIKKIRRSISGRFIYWLKHITVKQGLFLKISISLYALLWSPSEYLAYWHQKKSRE